MTQESGAFLTVLDVVQQYFEGLHHADTQKLARIFDPQIVLISPGIRRTRDQWLQLVRTRPTPRDAGYPFAYQVLAIEVMGNQAMVKVSCPLLDQHYLDYLGLVRENNQWTVVSKMYADYPS
ncbi:hypothetical protein BZG73_14395 [Salinivibrio siamensis]|uniref:Nuclear transport factor 2 family protein n=1 Tax=Salinivibrio siamensis TaxID=414286 RepID=A0ABX3K5L6_9GAMM|nr:nuclear transport factor 2 family protein [Salinivibrio siamensis]OOE80605.1 hypothetical protein BZG73_14395 [Salinivibrio siamensis]